jgi:uncharacterized damage-inducible protein DinB
MDAVVASNLALYRAGAALVEKAFGDVKPDDLWRQPEPQCNSLLWLLGHVTRHRCMLLGRCDPAAPKFPWGDAFARGGTPGEPERAVPFADLLRCFRETSARLVERLPALTDAELSASLGHKMPQGDETLRGMVAFLVFHEAYHVGQIGYLKKQLGYAPLIR